MSIATPEIQSRGDQVVGNDVRAALAQLNEEQQRAHDIVEEWLKEHIASELKKNLTKITDWPKETDGQANQLRMLLLGGGGTGKTRVIEAITQTFRLRALWQTWHTGEMCDNRNCSCQHWCFYSSLMGRHTSHRTKGRGMARKINKTVSRETSRKYAKERISDCRWNINGG